MLASSLHQGRDKYEMQSGERASDLREQSKYNPRARTATWLRRAAHGSYSNGSRPAFHTCHAPGAAREPAPNYPTKFLLNVHTIEENDYVGVYAEHPFTAR